MLKQPQPSVGRRGPKFRTAESNAVAQNGPGVGLWKLSWILVAPLAIWLGLAKTIIVLNAFYWAPKNDASVVDLLRWLSWFTSLRFLAAVLAALVAQRLLFPRRPWVVAPLAAGFMIAMAFALTLLKPDQTVWMTLVKWADSAAMQYAGLAASLWRDAGSVALVVFVFGVVISLATARAHRAVVWALQVVVVALCALVGIDLAYQFATGNPANSQVLMFAVKNAWELVPLVTSEVTWLRTAGLTGGVVIAGAWAWWHRAITRLPVRATHRNWFGGVIALVASTAVLFPPAIAAPAHVLRNTEGTLVNLVKTLSRSEMQEIEFEIARMAEMEGRPPWHSAHMRLQATERARAMNVVVVMMESVRAASTTVNAPELPTMPFLKRLSEEGAMVEDMNAVAARTAAAWIAVLGGQYPLGNQETARWVAENRKIPRMRSLPSVLRDIGYATSFFTPSDLNFQSDIDIIKGFNFELVMSEPDFSTPGAERPTYFGLADEVMVEPILSWSAAQLQAKRPFFAAIMTNVGHHTYETPSTWEKVKFAGVSDPTLESYYNCLLYIDHVLSLLVEGYRQIGALDDTVFVFVGDHGALLGEHNSKDLFVGMYEESLRVPAVIYAPGLSLPQQRVRGPRQQIDILPTIADLLGYRIEGARLPGQSLLHPVDPQRELFFTSSIDWVALAARRGHRKYIQTFNKPMEVFDLDKDPAEAHPLADVPADEIARMEGDMQRWRAKAALSMMSRPASDLDANASWLRK